MSVSVVDRLGVADVLLAAGREAPNPRGWFICPSHADARPSAHVVGGRGWRCFGCGAKGGVLDLAVALRIGRDRREAAAALERRRR